MKFAIYTLFLLNYVKKYLNSREKFAIIIYVVWVWRSLVARVNGVHEAGGSIPLTQTILLYKSE